MRRFNPYIVQCRKERHFVDFGKKRREEQDPEMAPAQRKVNTVFEVPVQALTLGPLSYDQYQMLQQSCFHFLNLNEFMLIETFINKFFATATCLVQQQHGQWVPAGCQTILLQTQDQIWEKAKTEGVQRTLVKSQLKGQLALVREALTAPSACREYDYERLEFYGDSIIGFLVILELFLLN